MANLMNGTYYEIVDGLDEDIVIKVNDTTMTDQEAKNEAWETERSAFKRTYENGVLKEQIKLYGESCLEKTVGNTYYEPLPREMRFRYSMLSRLKADCDYFLGNRHRFAKHLWAGSVDKHIQEMKDRWNSFNEDEKPEWLTWEDILNYEKQMKED